MITRIYISFRRMISNPRNKIIRVGSLPTLIIMRLFIESILQLFKK